MTSGLHPASPLAGAATRRDRIPVSTIERRFGTCTARRETRSSVKSSFNLKRKGKGGIAMRRRLFAAGVILLLVALYLAPAGAEGTGLLITPDQIDLGTVDEGPPAVATVTLENAGDVAVKVTGIRTN
jgi:hypothetical protein